jgi:hypothetical protein
MKGTKGRNRREDGSGEEEGESKRRSNCEQQELVKVEAQTETGAPN